MPNPTQNGNNNHKNIQSLLVASRKDFSLTDEKPPDPYEITHSANSRADLNFVPKVYGEWTQYATTDGRPYFHNSRTGETRWTIPRQIKDLVPLENPSPWVEFEKAGQTMFYNTTTKEVTALRPKELIDETKTALMSRSKLEVYLGIARAERMEKGDTSHCLSEKEIETHFKNLLSDVKVVTPDSAWAEMLTFIIKDPRYCYVPTLAKRKLIFESFKEELRAIALKPKEEALPDGKAEKEFLKSLRECGRISVSAKFEDAEAILSSDPRYSAVSLTTERKKLFDQHIAALAEIETRRRLRKEEDLADFKRIAHRDIFFTRRRTHAQIEDHLATSKRYRRADCCSRLKMAEMVAAAKEKMRERAER